MTFEKDTESQIPRYIVGKKKRHDPVIVEFKHERWKCDCGYLAKIGIPCVHLIPVLHA